jgi:hypothetical protein
MEALAILFSSLIVILAMVGAAIYGYQVGYRDGSEDMSEFVKNDPWCIENLELEDKEVETWKLA